MHSLHASARPQLAVGVLRDVTTRCVYKTATAPTWRANNPNGRVFCCPAAGPALLPLLLLPPSVDRPRLLRRPLCMMIDEHEGLSSEFPIFSERRCGGSSRGFRDKSLQRTTSENDVSRRSRTGTREPGGGLDLGRKLRGTSRLTQRNLAVW